MDTRSSKGHTEHTPEHKSPRRGGGRWFALYMASTTATLLGGAGAAYADPPKGIPDAACGIPHDPDHDRDQHFHKRCEHYRHRHLFHRGHDGNAQLAVRTLIDSSGMAVLEATTGTFDDGSVPPGSIDKLHVRITHPDKKRHADFNFNPKGSAGYFTAPLGQLAHGQAITVDATISGIDRGKDQVSVDDTVQYRPDLAVVRVDVPATVGQALPVSVAATVRETKRDLGGTADCILSADGTVIDRASNMWVDAGGMVSCHFTARFTSLGQHALHISVGHVQPGDYSMANNSADATVTVAMPFAFTASAYDATYSGTNVTEVLDSSGNVIDSENDTFGGSNQSFSLNGNWGMAVTFPLASVSALATSGGTTWSIIGLANLPAGSSDPTSGTCGAGADTTGYNWVTVCTQTVNGAPTTTVNLSEFAGDVTYHSDGVCQLSASHDCANGFTWNTDTSSVYAPRHPFTGSLTVNLNISDAAGTNLQAFPVLPMTPYTSQYNIPLSCNPQPDGTQDCSSNSYLETGVTASVTQ